MVIIRHTMAKNLQKTADFYRKRVGIVNPQAFARNVQIHYFEPAKSLAPFVAHYFVARLQTQDDPEYTASYVLSQPAVHLLFTPEESSIIGITTRKHVFRLKDRSVFAGARFKPGGFYPFWNGRMADLAEKTIPASEVFPQANATFVADLLTQSDPEIADTIERLLKRKQPKQDEKLELVKNITATIETQRNMHTTQAVAKTFGLSERTLQDLFTTRVGVGVKWIIMRTRFLEAMERAHLAAKPDWTMVAAELGYSTQSHFINDFKKIIGISPTQYVKTLAAH